MVKFASITNVRKVAGNKFQLQVEQQIESEVQQANLLAKYNSADERFNQSKPQFAWLTIDKGNLSTVQDDFLNFPADEVKALGEGQSLALDILAPSWNIQIEERSIPNTYEKENMAITCKQIEIQENTSTLAMRYYMSKGKQGLNCSDLIRNDKSGKLVGEKAYFLTLEGSPIFQDKRVVASTPVHLKFPDYILVHESEVSFLTEIDITKGSNKPTVKEKVVV